MATVPIPAVYDELLDYLVSKATPEEILAFKASEAAETRATYLSDRNNAGALTEEEELELQNLLHLDRKVSLFKAQAAAALKRRL